MKRRGSSILVIFILGLLILSFVVAKSSSVEQATTTESQTKTTTYIYAGNLVASKSSDESKTQYYIQDHLGSNVKVVDGGIKQTNKYYSFGETQSFGETDNDYKYTGKELDSETGLYYYGARYYKPELGRFIQADALKGSIGDPLSMNRYAYVKNNPLKYVDPSGNAEGNPLDSEFYTKPVSSPLDWALRTCGGACQHLGRVQDLPILGAIGDALIGMGQPTSLKEDIESGNIAGVGGGLKMMKGSKLTIFRGDKMGAEKLERVVNGEGLLNKWHSNVDEFRSVSSKAVYESGIEKVAVDHSLQRTSESGMYGVSFSESRKVAEEFAGFGQLPDPNMPNGIRVLIKAEVSLNDPFITRVKYGPGGANPAFSWEQEVFIARPLEANEYKIIKIEEMNPQK